MAETPIQRQRETWFVTNVSNDNIRITDIPSIPVLKPAQRIDLLVYTSLLNAQSSTVISAYISNGRLSSEEYLHTHDDRAEAEHVHTLDEVTDVTATTDELTQLTDGSNADDLHTHEGTVGVPEHNDLTDIQGGSNNNYYHLKKNQHNKLTDGSDSDSLHTHDSKLDATHLTDFTHSDIALNTADRHDELHTIVSHSDTTATGDELNTLTGGSNADALHTHDGKSDVGHAHILTDVTDVTATKDEINQALDGIGATVTDTNLDTLTNNSNADALHTHAGGGGTSIHNNLTGLQGGDPSTDEFYHLTSADLVVLDNTSNTNTGDQDLSDYFLKTVDDTADITEATDKNFVTDADLVVLGNTSNTNTGDQDLSGLVPYTGASTTVDLGTHTLQTTGVGIFGYLDVDTLNLNGNVISDSTGTISFSDDNLITTGNISLLSNISKLYLGDAQQSSIYFDGVDLYLTLNEPSQTGLIKFTDDINIVSNSAKLYFGANQESSIYFDGTDLNISLNEPSQNGLIKLTDDVEVIGDITAANLSGTNSGDQTSSDFDHNALLNYLSAEHIDWTNATQDLLTTGSVTANNLLITEPTGTNYAICGRGSNILSIESTTSDTACIVEQLTNDGLGNKDNRWRLFGKGKREDFSTFELLDFGFSSSDRAFEMKSRAAGAGTLLPVKINNQNHANQFVCNPDGTIDTSGNFTTAGLSTATSGFSTTTGSFATNSGGFSTNSGDIYTINGDITATNGVFSSQGSDGVTYAYFPDNNGNGVYVYGGIIGYVYGF